VVKSDIPQRRSSVNSSNWAVLAKERVERLQSRVDNSITFEQTLRMAAELQLIEGEDAAQRRADPSEKLHIRQATREYFQTHSGDAAEIDPRDVAEEKGFPYNQGVGGVIRSELKRLLLTNRSTRA
jgi:hypothetical protein